MSVISGLIEPASEDLPVPSSSSITKQAKLTLLDLFETLTEAASLAHNIDNALSNYLSAICQYSGWPIGHLYRLDENSTLVSSRLWHVSRTVDKNQIAPFQIQSENTTFKPEEGLIGSVFSSGKPTAIANAQEDPNFLRSSSSRLAGMRGYFAFPVTIEGNSIAVMEFLSFDIALMGEELSRVISLAGQQAGRILERHAHKQKLEKMRQKFQSDVSEVVQSVAATASQLSSTSTTLGALISETHKKGQNADASAEQAHDRTVTLQEDTDALLKRTEAAKESTAKSQGLSELAVSMGATASENLNSLSRAVSDVDSAVTMVRQITKATRMLALNATIEAQRAGIHGEGFAVVADEVKALATETDNATNTIAELIGNISDTNNISAISLEKMVTTISDLHTLSSQAAERVHAQNQTCNEMAKLSDEAAACCETASQQAKGVGHAIDHAVEAAAEVKQAAILLKEQGSLLNSSVEAFLASLN